MRRLMFLASLCLLASACAEARAAEPAERKYEQVLVATRDLPAGSIVTYDNMGVKELPEGYLSSSVVREGNAAFIKDQKVLLPVLKGDLVLWSFFTLSPIQNEVLGHCPKPEGNDASAEEQVARARQTLLSRGR
ncbi:SAF domain-containing protein [Hyalangium sp.]|uniref:SAF domain-containing protein n=1 Tax=Hyalangium sp. TaxID=2028555 RepID=UPI002D582CB2|nr:SAF domain-containing protein [Hyalangium sp.]HYI00658.1 SAF domain-containing protein [Hyalangium sp.]